ncbi:MAG: hypothetical protein ABIH83_03035 [Candidatus Micrarchaeota archaeon]
MKKYYGIFALFGILFLFGCYTIVLNSDTLQKFKLDGSSEIEAEGELTADLGELKTLMEYSASMSEDEEKNPDMLLIEGMIEYFESRKYAEDICSAADNVHCEVTNDNHILIKTTMPPGEFYEHAKSTDASGKDRYVYKIKKAPIAFYYLQEGDVLSDAVSDGMDEYVKNYIEENFDNSYPDKYCEESEYAVFSCELKSKAGEEAEVGLSSQYSDVVSKVVWAGCSQEEVDDVLMMDESEAKENVYSAKDVNKEVGDDEESVKVSCPSGYNTLILFVEIEYEEETSASVDAYKIMNREEKKQDIIAALDEDEESGIDSGEEIVSGKEANIIDFENGKIGGSTYSEFIDELAETGESEYGPYYEVNIVYRAQFEGNVESAKIGATDIDVSSNEIEINLEELEEYGPGAVEVVVLSGAATGGSTGGGDDGGTLCVPAATFAMLAGFVIFNRRK